MGQLWNSTRIRFDHHPNGFAVGTATPSLSWHYTSSLAPSFQKSYTLDICRADSQYQRHVVSDQTVHVPWPDDAPPLRSRERLRVRVMGSGSATSSVPPELEEGLPSGERAWMSSFSDDPNRVAEWTPLEVGLLHKEDWKAKFITSPDPPPPDGVPHRPTLYQKTFLCKSKKYARLYISCLGIYEAYINGKRVGDHVMAPGWTSYHHRVQYQTYDVTNLLERGENVLAVEVAEGWYAGRLLWMPGHRNVYGDKPAFIAQLEIHDDTEDLRQVLSDDSWECRPSPTLSASIYDGEVYDAREKVVGWNTNVMRVSGWQKTRILDVDLNKVRLVSTDAPPVRVTQIVQPVKVFTSPSGKTLVDFGQNLVGRVHIHGRLSKRSGHVLRIRHAEVLENGELGTRPLRDAKATDEYIFSGHENVRGRGMDWNPHFTFHGFRYIELQGWSLDDEVPPSPDTLSALVLHSDMRRTGHFTCSNELVNKLHENVTWSMRGNFLSIPTDCPQRDERLGWTGDIQVFAPTASFLYSSGGLLSNWLRDLSIDQKANNSIVPVVIPDALQHYISQNVEPVAVWDDAAILVPWTIHRWTGDTAVLQRQWPSMVAHLDTAIQRGPDGLWDPSLFQYGDWLDPNAPPDQADLARTDGTLVADAYLVHVTTTMAQIAVIIGNAAAARKYQAQSDLLKNTFADKYITKTGLVVSDSQTALSLAICFELFPSSKQLQVAGARLARLVKAAGYRVSTGFAGTPLVLHALSATGQTDLAYEMLLTKECPSWLYPVTMGATTIWERWDSMLPDGRINPGSMTSFNHYALGSVAAWLHAVVGGIDMIESGWKTFRVRPRPSGGLDRCEVSFESPYGRVGVQWAIGDGKGPETTRNKVFRARVEVPPNTRALVCLPGQGEDQDNGEWKDAGIWEMECVL